VFHAERVICFTAEIGIPVARKLHKFEKENKNEYEEN
jgi:hypothetical protein